MTKSYFYILIKIIFLTHIFIASTYAQADTIINNKNEYGMAFTKNIFLNVDVNDAFAALKVWVNEMNKRQNMNVRMFPVLYNDMNDLTKYFKKIMFVLLYVILLII